MEARGIHLTLWLLTLSMLTQMPSGNLFSPELKNELCESGYLGDICNYPVKRGFCTAILYRYYFNKVTSSCEPFIFSGCGGNRNNFKAQYLCEHYCLQKQVSLLVPHPALNNSKWLRITVLPATPKKRLGRNEHGIMKLLPDAIM
ncbi:kunitz-type serine protease inhibitor textilinin-3-like [Psammomys obesus]|uniref:kunitz-type serine protease inhibitor textilinin-3-like n=1 Tax=Psammomys obesus TaxID=48139 RepID=UPI002452CC1D|nr:kunitz-type serine protease inhibitor textilinin-3-like [Psammomys obesus]